MKFIVTLDGSEASDAVLGPALNLAEAAGAEIVLFSVLDRDDVRELAKWPLPGGQPPPEHENEAAAELRLSAEIEAALKDKAAPFEQAGLPVRTLVRIGDPYEQIVALCTQESPDLLAMATHGHGGLLHRLMGGVSGRIVESGIAPILLVRPAN
jgi:nucleotide-binding universal stress UspA family protein